MQKSEFSVLAMAMRTAYGQHKFMTSEEELSLWFEMLKELPYDLTQQAIREWIANNKWSPTIADIRTAVIDKMKNELPDTRPNDWGEAYERVIDLIHTHGWIGEAEALQEMDEMTKSVVKGIGGYRYLCESENPEMDRANFRKLYETRQARQTESQDDVIKAFLTVKREGIAERA